jgi:hypothetical protein
MVKLRTGVLELMTVMLKTKGDADFITGLLKVITGCRKQ